MCIRRVRINNSIYSILFRVVVSEHRFEDHTQENTLTSAALQVYLAGGMVG